ncbi:MAG: PIN domain-containing protein [Opitutales bacterium]|jgi:predicted nucleic acid-binding protein
MNHLLDANALLAWHHPGSPHHAAFHAWVKRVGRATLRTCALTELAFVRVSMQAFGYTLAQAQQALAATKAQVGGFVAAAPSPMLPAWASAPHKTTDAWLCQLASAHDLQLATFDTGIKDPAALHIPVR